MAHEKAELQRRVVPAPSQDGAVSAAAASLTTLSASHLSELCPHMLSVRSRPSLGEADPRPEPMEESLALSAEPCAPLQRRARLC